MSALRLAQSNSSQNCLNRLSQVCVRNSYQQQSINTLFANQKNEAALVNVPELQRLLVSCESTRNLLSYIRSWIERTNPTPKTNANQNSKNSNAGSKTGAQPQPTKTQPTQKSEPTHIENWVFKFLVSSLKSISFRQKKLQVQNIQALEKWFISTLMVRQSAQAMSALKTSASEESKIRVPRASFQASENTKPFRNFEAFKRLKDYSRRTFDSEPKLLMKTLDKARAAQAARIKAAKGNVQRDEHAAIQEEDQNGVNGLSNQKSAHIANVSSQPNFEQILIETDKRRYLSAQRQLKEQRQKQEIQEKVRQFKRSKERYYECFKPFDVKDPEDRERSDTNATTIKRLAKTVIESGDTSQKMSSYTSNQDSQRKDKESEAGLEQNLQIQNQIKVITVCDFSSEPAAQVGAGRLPATKLQNWIRSDAKFKKSLAKDKLLLEFAQDNTQQKFQEVREIKQKFSKLDTQHNNSKSFNLRGSRSTGFTGLWEKSQVGRQSNKYSLSILVSRPVTHQEDRHTPNQVLYKGMSAHISAKSAFNTDKDYRLPKNGLTLMSLPPAEPTFKTHKASKSAFVQK